MAGEPLCRLPRRAPPSACLLGFTLGASFPGYAWRMPPARPPPWHTQFNCVCPAELGRPPGSGPPLQAEAAQRSEAVPCSRAAEGSAPLRQASYLPSATAVGASYPLVAGVHLSRLARRAPLSACLLGSCRRMAGEHLLRQPRRAPLSACLLGSYPLRGRRAPVPPAKAGASIRLPTRCHSRGIVAPAMPGSSRRPARQRGHIRIHRGCPVQLGRLFPSL